MKDSSLLVAVGDVAVGEPASSTGRMADRHDPVAGGRYGNHRSEKTSRTGSGHAQLISTTLGGELPRFPPGLFIFRRCETQAAISSKPQESCQPRKPTGDQTRPNPRDDVNRCCVGQCTSVLTRPAVYTALHMW